MGNKESRDCRDRTMTSRAGLTSLTSVTKSYDDVTPDQSEELYRRPKPYPYTTAGAQRRADSKVGHQGAATHAHVGSPLVAEVSQPQHA